MLRHVAVVLQRLGAVGLLVGCGKRNVANLQQLRRGKENHVRRIVKQRVHQAALVHHNGSKPGALRLNGTRHAGGAGANHQHVKVVAFVIHESFILQGSVGCMRSWDEDASKNVIAASEYVADVNPPLKESNDEYAWLD